MIHSTALRIGNYVRVGNPPAKGAHEIGKIALVGIEPATSLYNGGACIVSIYQGILSSEYRNLEPIPLTETILRACKSITSQDISGNIEFTFKTEVCNITAAVTNDAECHVRVWKDSGGLSFDVPNCSNVHELQNLYYALNGRELEINP